MIERIISGGQTGVDQAALNVAAELDLPRGGWCPKGRWSEGGVIDERYPLTETPSPDPAQRTEWNVRDADGTLIIANEPLTGGTLLTRELAIRLRRPFLIVEPDDPAPRALIRRWLTEHGIRTLNVAGPRESRSPGIYEAAARVLRAALGTTTVEETRRATEGHRDEQEK